MFLHIALLFGYMSENKKDTNPPVGVPRQVVNYILLTFSWLCASLYFKRVALPPQVIGCNM